jgi:hypothetical protein
MLRVVLATFLAASAANLGANAAEVCGKLRPARHEPRRDAADHGALMVEVDAAGHLLNVLLPQAGAGAMFALSSALVAGFDAASILLVHNLLLGLASDGATCAGDAGRKLARSATRATGNFGLKDMR